MPRTVPKIVALRGMLGSIENTNRKRPNVNLIFILLKTVLDPDVCDGIAAYDKNRDLGDGRKSALMPRTAERDAVVSVRLCVRGGVAEDRCKKERRRGNRGERVVSRRRSGAGEHRGHC